MALEHGQNGRPRVSAAPISRVVAVINPVSGAGLDSSATTMRVAIVREALARVGLAPTVHVTERAGHARELAAAAVRDAADLLIVWGGDGTSNEAASALVGSVTSLGLIPAGSGNGLAASLGVPRAPEAALQHLLSSPPRAVDVGTFAGRPFFNIAGIGLDAHIARLFNLRGRGRRGKWPYVAIGVREGWTYKARRYQIELDGDRRTVSALLLAFANGREYGMGACISPGARLDDGWLDATVVEDRPAVARFLDARHLATRTIDRARRVLLRRVRSAMVTAEEPMQYHLDGEPGVIEGTVEIGMMPGALRVRA
jgi:diacylglycerol kinase (ATP)